ncbi:MAG: MFS transporter [bacterium]|nr:MFS transporter [bacterium]
MRGVLVLASAIIILLCLGGVYAWSAYVPALRDTYGYSSTQTQVVFGSTIAVFTLVMTWAGRVQTRYGPRQNALLAALLFVGGYGLAGMSGGKFWLLWLGIGVVSGAAIGCGYVAALATPLQWFPRHKGLVTGLAAAGFGGGAIVTTWVVEYMIRAQLGLGRVFEFKGMGYGIVIGVCALVLSTPGGSQIGGQVERGAVARVLGERLFWTLVAGMWSGTFAGLLVIGNLKSIGVGAGLGAGQANLAISLFAIGNAAGRIIWGRWYDTWGYRVIPVSLAFLSLSLVILRVLPTRGEIFVLTAFLIGFGFGACFVVYAAQVAACYGVTQFSKVYPLVFMAYGVAGITGPLMGGWLHDLCGDYRLAILIAAALVLGGAMVCRKEPVRSRSGQ